MVRHPSALLFKQPMPARPMHRDVQSLSPAAMLSPDTQEQYLARTPYPRGKVRRDPVRGGLHVIAAAGGVQVWRLLTRAGDRRQVLGAQRDLPRWVLLCRWHHASAVQHGSLLQTGSRYVRRDPRPSKMAEKRLPAEDQLAKVVTCIV